LASRAADYSGAFSEKLIKEEDYKEASFQQQQLQQTVRSASY
jgi:hypothetical protein